MNSPEAKPTEFSLGRVLAVALPFVAIAMGIVAYTYYGTKLTGSSTYTIDDLVPVTLKLTFRDQPLVGAEVRAHGADGEPVSIATTDENGVASLETDIGNGVLGMGVFKKELRVTVSARLPGTGTPGPEFTPESYRTKEKTPLVVDFGKLQAGEELEFVIADDETSMSQEAIDAHMAQVAQGQANAAEMSAARDRQNAGGGSGGPGGGGPGGGGPGGRRGPGAQGPGDGGSGEETPATETPATETPATETPATETPATEPPATETPAAETPAAETPATETPATETPATETPATEPASGGGDGGSGN